MELRNINPNGDNVVANNLTPKGMGVPYVGFMILGRLL
jgi:hypothetical protein